jgi:hypothetical protein
METHTNLLPLILLSIFLIPKKMRCMWCKVIYIFCRHFIKFYIIHRKSP